MAGEDGDKGEEAERETPGNDSGDVRRASPGLLSPLVSSAVTVGIGTYLFERVEAV